MDKQINVANLKKLLSFIQDKNFNKAIAMDYLRSEINSSGVFIRVYFHSLDDCGTHGCLLGICPFIPTLEPINKEFIDGDLYFSLYAHRIFGQRWLASPALSYLFGPESYDDETPILGQCIAHLKTIIVALELNPVSPHWAE